jgi:hypothetical protein
VAVRVIERDPGAVDADSLPADVPTTLFAPREAPDAVAGCDVLFVTGATLVYGGVETYLDAATAADVPAVVLIGATASFLPAPVFARGVDLLAGARVLDPTRVRERVAAGDCGTGLHDAGVRKVYHPSTPALPGLDSLTGRPETGGRDP